MIELHPTEDTTPRSDEDVVVFGEGQGAGAGSGAGFGSGGGFNSGWGSKEGWGFGSGRLGGDGAGFDEPHRSPRDD